MTPINNKISSPDNYPKAERLRNKTTTRPDNAKNSATPSEAYSPNWNDGKDAQILNLRRVAQESGRMTTFGGKGDPTGIPADWRHSVDANGNSVYRNGFVDESAYRPKVTVRKKKRNAPPLQKAEARPEVGTEPSATRKSPPAKSSNSLWRPESIPKYRVIPKKVEAPEAQAPRPKRTGADSIGSPGNNSGVEQRTTTSRKYATEEEAKTAFRRQSESLLRPGGWNSKPIGLGHADAPEWSLMDDKGQEARTNRQVKQGDVLKIANPGKTNYFVEVERAHSSDGNVQFTVRPTNDPTMPKNGETTHFFTKESTRNFTLQRLGKEVIFNTEGRNETLNISSEAGPFTVGNAAGGTAIMSGLGDAYWGQFAKQLMNR